MRGPRMADDDDRVRACLGLLERRAPRALSLPEMAAALGFERWDRRRLRAALESRVAHGELRRVGKTRYRWVRLSERTGRRPAPRAAGRGSRVAGPRRGPRLEGRYVRTRSGHGFVEVLGRAAERFRRDLLVPAGMEGGALHGDRVEIEVERPGARTRRAVARVVAVTEPVHAQMIGAVDRVPAGWCIVPEDELLPPVRIVGGPALGPEDRGKIALVCLTRPPAPGRWPEGDLVRIVGAADDPEVHFLTIALGHGLRIEFPSEVLAEAARLPADPDDASLAGRRDLRALPFVTIDGETARDFDDAVCLEPDGDGWRLWVAIADVAHYVEPGSEVDREAARRGTSVYFPDRAIPMLPARLSSGLCSLLPHRPRLVVVAEMAYDARGRRTGTDLYRAVIASRARLTYATVGAAFAPGGPGAADARSALGDLAPQLDAMRTLMQHLLRRRLASGSLDLDLPEALIDLSEEGRSVGVRLLERTDAHRLIEELMLEANRAVATFLRDRDVPLPYRIHEPPDPADVDELNDFLAPFGFRLAYDAEVDPADAQRLLRALAGHPLARVLSRQVLRSLKQARYSTRNVGHFGLAFPVYCHFTSPIRRHPDLLVHRQLGRVLDGDAPAARADARALEDASIEGSAAERRAVEAERAMLDLKKAEFMQAHLREPGPGTIVSVVEFGFFVELDEYPVEGLVRIDELGDGRHRFVEAERALVGSRGRSRFRLGDRVLVEATSVSLRRREIDFALLGRLDGTAAKPPAPRTPRPGPRPARPTGRRARPPRRGRGARRP